MLENTLLSVAEASPSQLMAFAIYATHDLLHSLAYLSRADVAVAANGTWGGRGYRAMAYYLVVFAAGFAGSFHCIGMCGGFACALGRDPQGAGATVCATCSTTWVD